ncbi:MAG TPA: hypothetical protein VFY61_17850 [Pyrinomonadaceae bacterium]|nr:hypothetical protein [Pyrinomonadaceae bacterium]
MRNLPQRVAAEALGTAMLLAAVVGSGIMGERLAAGNMAVALLANTLATGQSSRDACQSDERYVQWNSSRGRAWIHRRATSWRRNRHATLSRAGVQS